MENEKPQARSATGSNPQSSIPNIYLLSPTSRPGVKHLPMIRFTLIPQSLDFSGFDGLILTSKQGVIALDEVSGGTWKHLPSAAIGKQTASEIEARGGRVIYMASKAYGDVLARELAERFGTAMRWLYARPKVVVSKIAADLRKAGIVVEEAVLYETSCIRYDERQKPRRDAVIIFTAPSVVRCFFENFSWDESWKAVAIGEKTAQALPEFVKPHITPSPSLEEAVEFARKLSQDRPN